MSFSLPIVTGCPVTVSQTANIYLSPEVIAQLNGLLYSETNNEWAAVGKGRTSPSGLTIYVESLWIPPQDRSTSQVHIREHDLEPDDVVVFHSHHGMGAFWSGTDLSELNPRYPASIVVANLGSSSNTSGAQSHENFGFDCKSTAVVTLPCGKLGRVEGWVASAEALELWMTYGMPLEDGEIFLADGVDHTKTMHNCVDKMDESFKYTRSIFPSCINDIAEQDQYLVTLDEPIEQIYGRSDELVAQLPKPNAMIMRTFKGRNEYEFEPNPRFESPRSNAWTPAPSVLRDYADQAWNDEDWERYCQAEAYFDQTHNDVTDGDVADIGLTNLGIYAMMELLNQALIEGNRREVKDILRDFNFIDALMETKFLLKLEGW